MHAGDPRKRHLDLVLPGGRESQRFRADSLELAEEHLVAGEVDPDIGPNPARRLRVDRKLGVAVQRRLGVHVGGLAVFVIDVDREVFLEAVTRRRLEEDVGGRLDAGALE